MQIHDRNALRAILSLPTLPQLPEAIGKALEPAHSGLAIGPFRKKPASPTVATHYEVLRCRYQHAVDGDRAALGKYLDSLQRDVERAKAQADFLRHRAQIKVTFRSVEQALEEVVAALPVKTPRSNLRTLLQDTQQAFLMARDDLTRAEQTVRQIGAAPPRANAAQFDHATVQTGA